VFRLLMDDDVKHLRLPGQPTAGGRRKRPPRLRVAG